MGVPLLKGASTGSEIPQWDQTARSTGGAAEKVAAASIASGTATLDLNAASVFTASPSADITTVNITNVPSSRCATVTFIVTQGATPRAVASPTGAKFLGAASPTQVANKVCEFTYKTVDGGTTWLCSGVVEV